MTLSRSYFSNQGLNLGHISEPAESKPLDQQGTPHTYCLVYFCVFRFYIAIVDDVVLYH